MKGLYHQRSGVEMLPPYTDFIRARDHHPDDGTKVYHSTAPYLCSGNGYNAEGTETNNFDTLVYGKTERIVPEAWGGVMDAGDWDRQIRHLKGTARKLLELAELDRKPLHRSRWVFRRAATTCPTLWTRRFSK